MNHSSRLYISYHLVNVMGRARTKAKRVKPVASNSTAEGKEPPSIPSLLEKAQTLIVQCDYDLAQRFALRILEREPSNVDGKEILGVTQLETGDIDSAKQVSSINCTELDLVLQLVLPPQSSVDILNPYSSTSRCTLTTTSFCPSISCSTER